MCLSNPLEPTSKALATRYIFSIYLCKISCDRYEIYINKRNTRKFQIIKLSCMYFLTILIINRIIIYIILLKCENSL